MKIYKLRERLLIFTIGLLIMSFGIVLMIKANFGVSPWDVLHVGLFYQFGLTIGTWSILVGVSILSISAIMLKRWPRFGSYLNMILVGLFIDMYMLIPFLTEPNTMIGKGCLFLVGMIINAYGMGIYISAEIGAGPRDSFMLAIQQKTGWKLSTSRRVMEVIVLIIGWLLGGPVFIGTIIFSLAIGSFIGFAMPQCQAITNKLLKKQVPKKINKQIERGVHL